MEKAFRSRQESQLTHNAPSGVSRRNFGLALAGIGASVLTARSASAFTFGELDNDDHPATGAVVLT